MVDENRTPSKSEMQSAVHLHPIDVRADRPGTLVGHPHNIIDSASHGLKDPAFTHEREDSEFLKASLRPY